MASRKKASRPRRRIDVTPELRTIGTWLGGLAALTGLLSFTDGFFWVGAAAGELLPHASLLALFAGVLALLGAGWWQGAVALLVFGACAWPVAELWMPHKGTPGKGPALRVALVHADASDVHNASIQLRIGGVGGKADLSHETLSLRTSLPTVGPAHRAPGVLATRVSLDACEMQLVAFDLPSVFDSAQKQRRRETIEALSRLKQRRPALWLGRLGSRAATSDVAELIAQHGLRDTRYGHGRLPTWPGEWGPLGFDVDHILVRGWVVVQERGRIPAEAQGAGTSVATLQVTDRRCTP